MKLIKMALKNLNRQKKRSVLLGGAIAFGILVVTLLNGFAGSFMTNIGGNMAQLVAGHLFIEGVEKGPSGKTLTVIRDEAPLRAALEEAEIPYQWITRRSSFTGTLIFEGESQRQEVAGVDWRQEEYLKDNLEIIQGGLEDLSLEEGLLLSGETAEKLNLQVGDRLLVKMKTVTGQNNVGEFQVAGLFKDQGLFGSLSAYANLSYVNRLLNINPGEFSTLGIFLQDIRQVDQAADALYPALEKRVDLFPRGKGAQEGEGNPLQMMMEQAREESWEGIRYRFYTLNDILSSVQQLVAAINGVSVGILLILFLIIMVGITNTFRMVMYERIKEIGTMRALGMQRGRVRNLFLLEALFLALGGVLAGLAAAALVMGGLSLIPFGTEGQWALLLEKGHLSFQLHPSQVVGNMILVGFLTLLAALFPARKAARMSPASALRSVK